MKKRVTNLAEVGSVHDGSFGNALKLIKLAAECGADIVKFQTHIAEAETLKEAPMPSFFKGEPRYVYFERTGFSLEQWKELKSECDKQGIEFLSSPFSIEAVELLEEIGIKQYKVPSGEVTNLPLMKVIAETRKPVLLSSGMSTWQELDEAVKTFQKIHNNITVLQCTSEYPCSYDNVGLNIMQEAKERYQLPVGLSDHTITNYSAFTAVALGASVIEKHLTFSRKMYGSDAKHSLEPYEFSEMVKGIHAIETILSSKVDKDEIANRMGNIKEVFQKSIVSIVDIPKGTFITEEMIGFKKPGTGIPASKIETVLGKFSKRDILKDRLISKEDIENA
ncbi:MAG: N-acetylneuraminate synthase family protein [Bacteroidetes bacterium]|nr:N-acetylneuraminate synthase family protein [Bacteroidota bacterium]